MTLSGTSSRFAVWEDMAIEERLSWVECPSDHPSATTIGQLRIAGWPIPPLPIMDQTGEIHDAGLPVVASTALGPDEGRKLVDLETFDAKLDEFRKQAEAQAAEALEAAEKDREATSATIDAVADPATKTALQAIYGAPAENGKRK